MSLIISEKPNENLVLLRLNRPEVRNALSLQRRQELCLDRRERGGRQATHFPVPSNKSEV